MKVISIPNLLREKINSRLEEFSKVPQSLWHREVTLCLLTPQSRPQHAEKCVVLLEQNRFFEGRVTEKEVAEILRSPAHYVRFHNTKAKHVCALRENWQKLFEELRKESAPAKERDLLVKEVKGFGMKEASHALRNIGRRGLAILDRHILKNLHEEKIIEKIPNSLTPNRYIEIEELFRRYADDIGESMDLLDLFFWSKEAGEVFK